MNKVRILYRLRFLTVNYLGAVLIAKPLLTYIKHYPRDKVVELLFTVTSYLIWLLLSLSDLFLRCWGSKWRRGVGKPKWCRWRIFIRGFPQQSASWDQTILLFSEGKLKESSNWAFSQGKRNSVSHQIQWKPSRFSSSQAVCTATYWS